MRAIPCAAALLALSIAGCGAFSSCSGEHAVRTNPVLVVNGIPLSTEEMARRLEIRLRPHDALYVKDSENLRRTKEELLNQFIEQVFVSQWAKANGVDVSADQVDQEIQKARKSYPDDLTFRQALNDEKLSFETWKKSIEASLLQRAVFDRLAKDIKDPDEKAIRAYFDNNKSRFHQGARIRLRQVVLEKEDDARRLRDEIRQGASLEKIARQYSVAPEAAKGGDTGWIEKGTLEIFDQAFGMARGATSEVMKSPYGFHIIQVIDKKLAVQLNFEQSKASIRQILRGEMEQAHYLQWLEQQLRAAKVMRNDAAIEGMKAFTKAEK